MDRRFSVKDFSATIYRLAARTMFAPFGGLDHIRRRIIVASDLKSGDRVLELGCGPGDLTAMMTAAGAKVHAIDTSEEMLRVAAQRAPAASFELVDVRQYSPRDQYDVVLLAFVLHELPTEEVPNVIAQARGALATSGRLTILDHDVPPGTAGRVWRAVLNAIEPKGIDQWLGVDLPALCRRNGLTPRVNAALAGGRARLIVAQ